MRGASRRSTTRSTRRPARCKAKARFANAATQLFPNQFVNVRLLLRVQQGAIVVPVTAMRHGPNGDFVYVLNDDRTVSVRARDARHRHHRPGRRSTRACEVGERVVTEGGDRLKDGARVQLAADRAGIGRLGRRGRPAPRGSPAAAPGHGAAPRGAAASAASDCHALSPSRPFIQRPVATSLLMLAIVLAGLVGFRFLPLSALPQVDYPTIQVQTLYPGASPEVMSNTVTAPLERQFGQMAGPRPHELDQRGRRLDHHACSSRSA